MFPIDSKTKDYDQNMVETFDKLIAPKGYSWKLRDILPQVLVAGEPAGNLTEEGAKLLDPSGELEAGIPTVSYTHLESRAGKKYVRRTLIKKGRAL